MQRTYEHIGVHVPEIMLPAKGTDLGKWAVVACDQYTSQPDYWEKATSIAGDSPSTLHLTFPEIYLKDDDKDKRIININSSMEKYLQQGILEPLKPGFILVDRHISGTGSRKGLIIAVDLEKYNYNAGSQTLIRATEGTVLDRIPPRVKIREHAQIELPHILLLIDDPDKTVIEALFERVEKYEKLYDFQLMLDGGHIKGWKIDDENSLSTIVKALEKLADPSAFVEKYGTGPEKGVLLFAAGDGNHSLAAAKAHWENVKASLGCGEINHPARFALVELVNVHDSGIFFEPIHRVLFGIDRQKVLDEITQICPNCSCRLYENKTVMEETAKSLKEDNTIHVIPFILEGTYGHIIVSNPVYNLEVGTLQSLLDRLVKGHDDMEVDYIHGDEVVTELGSKKGNMGFYLPAMDKHDLFKTVILEGVLPRKTFSMGAANEKRYYLECRKIKRE